MIKCSICNKPLEEGEEFILEIIINRCEKNHKFLWLIDSIKGKTILSKGFIHIKCFTKLIEENYNV